MSVVDEHPDAAGSITSARENSHDHVLGGAPGRQHSAYVLLDGFDLGVGMLFGVTARASERGDAMMSAVAPIWDGNETWLVVVGRDPLGRLSGRLCDR